MPWPVPAPHESPEMLPGAASPVARVTALPPCARLGAGDELGEGARLGDLRGCRGGVVPRPACRSVEEM